MTTTLTERRSVQATPGTRPKRVRTGCLTCRARHLKCDEAVPNCQNCIKSNRLCKRGVRLNFLEVNVHHHRRVPCSKEWHIGFQDESRQIASEYRGGLTRYPLLDPRGTASSTGAGHGPSELEVNIRLPPVPGVVGSGSTSMAAADSLTQRNKSSYVPRPTPSPPGKKLLRLLSSSKEDIAILETKRNPAISLQLNHPGNTYESPIFKGHVPIKAEVVVDDRASDSASSAASILPQVTHAPPNKQRVKEKPDEEGGSARPFQTSASDEREYLGIAEEIQYMRVFVDEVAVWMDSFNQSMQFSHVAPYQALRSPMLLHACLACGVKHMSASSPALADKAWSYYNTATTHLLRSLQNPDRNVTECAAAAVILNVYEIMSGTAMERMNHMAGARALVRECRWNAATEGMGSACFWLNMEMEVMHCLAMNWHTTWDPENWGVDMQMPEGEDVLAIGREDLWVHKIFYIMTKASNFRASVPPFQEPTPQRESQKREARLAQWEELKDLCNRWNNACPRTMHPMGYLDPQPQDDSCFPKIWLIRRACVLSRLFYHTARYVVAQTAPTESPTVLEEWHAALVHHTQQICGIIAHTEDRGIASIAIRLLTIVGPSLIARKEQEEVVQILFKMSKQSGLHIENVEKRLKEAWGWNRPGYVRTLSYPSHMDDIYHGHTPEMPHGMSRVLAPPMMRYSPTSNPLHTADFSLPNHPYQNWYEPPNRNSSLFSPLLF